MNFRFIAHQHNSCSCWRACAWSPGTHRFHCLDQDRGSLCIWEWGWCLHTDLQFPSRAQSPDTRRCTIPPPIYPETRGKGRDCDRSRGPWCQCDQRCHRRKDSAQFHLENVEEYTSWRADTATTTCSYREDGIRDACPCECVCLHSCMFWFSTQMREGLLVPRPGGHPCKFFIRGVGKEDVQVCGAIQLQDLFQLFHI